ncbi:MAG TPA: FtsX-like permease family protein, partial [Ignavibacteriales bacterium]|nr:FtsX-like permease family protein [Ignavibacteriales bacterium]
LILLMACFNFTNLGTAGAASRAKEIGVRKAIGASRKILIGQFLTESVLIAFIAFPLAVVLTEILTPLAGKFFDRNIAINYLTDWKYLGMIMGLVALTGLFSGSYYALTVSRFNPVAVLSQKTNFSSSKSPFRKILITFQFVIFTGMIISSIVMYSQMEFLSGTDLGYKKENVLNLQIPYGIERDRATFKQMLTQVRGVRSVSINSTTPPFMGNILFYSYTAVSENKEYEMILIECDENYRDALGLRMAKGEFFTGDDMKNSNDKAVINETAAKIFGINTIGYTESKTGEPLNVIGIVKDFNINDLYGKIEPIIMRAGNRASNNYTIRIDGRAVPRVMERIQDTWKEFYPELPFEYKFLDDEYDARYRDDMRLSKMIGFFTGVALFIAVIGLFGISAYSASKRMKEIGIRKVFGASVGQMVFLLNKEVLLISSLGSLIAFPLAYYLMNKWLESFAYKIELDYGIFLASFALSLLIGIAAVSSQAFKAAAANPINSIEAE